MLQFQPGWAGVTETKVPPGLVRMSSRTLTLLMSVAAGLSIQWGQITPTLEMKVSYIAQAKAGRAVAEARTVKRGKTVLFLEADLKDAGGRLLATGSCTAMIAEMKKG